jgi:hypothetical protein
MGTFNRDAIDRLPTKGNGKMSTIQINSGAIEPTQDEDNNAVFEARPGLEPAKGTARFYSMNGAAFWLWLIETRVMGRRMRPGSSA